MLEQCVLQEIMELKNELCLMNLNCNATLKTMGEHIQEISMDECSMELSCNVNNMNTLYETVTEEITAEMKDNQATLNNTGEALLVNESLIQFSYETDNSLNESVTEEVTTEGNAKLAFRPRRSQRKRIRPLDKSSKSLESCKVPKLSDDVEDIEKFYLSKKFKRLPNTLETIFEEPKELSNKEMFSTRKFKRVIKFDESSSVATSSKIKKRSVRLKNLDFSKNFLNRKKVSMNKLMKTLSNVESD